MKLEYYCNCMSGRKKRQPVAAINWTQQQFSETLWVTICCPVKDLQDFHFQGCFGCWNILFEWDTWLYYHIYNFLIEEQASLCLCVAKRGTVCPEEEGMSLAYCPILLPQCEKTTNDFFFLHRRKNMSKGNTAYLTLCGIQTSFCFPAFSKEEMNDWQGMEWLQKLLCQKILMLKPSPRLIHGSSQSLGTPMSYWEFFNVIARELECVAEVHQCLRDRQYHLCVYLATLVS